MEEILTPLLELVSILLQESYIELSGEERRYMAMNIGGPLEGIKREILSSPLISPIWCNR